MISLYSLWGDAESRLNFKRGRPLRVGPLLAASRAKFQALNWGTLTCEEFSDQFEDISEKTLSEEEENDYFKMCSLKYKNPSTNKSIYPFRYLLHALSKLSSVNRPYTGPDDKWKKLYFTTGKSTKIRVIISCSLANAESSWSEVFSNSTVMKDIMTPDQNIRKNKIPLDLSVSVEEFQSIRGEVEKVNSDLNDNELGGQVSYKIRSGKKPEPDEAKIIADVMEIQNKSQIDGDLNFVSAFLERVCRQNLRYYHKTRGFIKEHFIGKRLRVDEIINLETRNHGFEQVVILACLRELKHIAEEKHPSAKKVLWSYISQFPNYFQDVMGHNKLYELDALNTAVYNRSKVHFDGVNAPAVKNIDRERVIGVYKLAYAAILSKYGAPFCIDLDDAIFDTPWEELSIYREEQRDGTGEWQTCYKNYGKKRYADVLGEESRKKMYENHKAHVKDLCSQFVLPDPEKLGNGYKVKRGFMNLVPTESMFTILWNEIYDTVLSPCSVPGLISMMCGDYNMHTIEYSAQDRSSLFSRTDFGDRFQFPGAQNYLKTQADGNDPSFGMAEFISPSQATKNERAYRQKIQDKKVVKGGCLHMLVQNLDDMVTRYDIGHQTEGGSELNSREGVLGILVWSLKYVPEENDATYQQQFKRGLENCRLSGEHKKMLKRLENAFARCFFQSFDPVILRDSFDYGKNIADNQHLIKYINNVMPLQRSWIAARKKRLCKYLSCAVPTFSQRRPNTKMPDPGEIEVEIDLKPLETLLARCNEAENQPGLAESCAVYKAWLDTLTKLAQDGGTLTLNKDPKLTPDDIACIFEVANAVHNSVKNIIFKDSVKKEEFMRQLYALSYNKKYSWDKGVLAAMKVGLPIAFMYYTHTYGLAVPLYWIMESIAKSLLGAQTAVVWTRFTNIIFPSTSWGGGVIISSAVFFAFLFDVSNTMFMGEFTKLTAARMKLREKGSPFTNPGSLARIVNADIDAGVFSQSLGARLVWGPAGNFKLADLKTIAKNLGGVKVPRFIAVSAAIAFAVNYKSALADTLWNLAYGLLVAGGIGVADYIIDNYDYLQCCRGFTMIAKGWCLNQWPEIFIPSFGYYMVGKLVYALTVDIFSITRNTEWGQSMMKALESLCQKINERGQRPLEGGETALQLSQTNATMKSEDIEQAKREIQQFAAQYSDTSSFICDDNNLSQDNYKRFQTQLKELVKTTKGALEEIQDKSDPIFPVWENVSQCLENLETNRQSACKDLEIFDGCTQKVMDGMYKLENKSSFNTLCSGLNLSGDQTVINDVPVSPDQIKNGYLTCKLFALKKNINFDEQATMDLLKSPNVAVIQTNNFLFFILSASYLATMAADYLCRTQDGLLQNMNMNAADLQQYSRTEVLCDSKSMMRSVKSKALVNVGAKKISGDQLYSVGWQRKWAQYKDGKRYSGIQDTTKIFENVKTLQDYEDTMDESGKFIVELSGANEEPYAVSRYRGCTLTDFDVSKSTDRKMEDKDKDQ